MTIESRLFSLSEIVAQRPHWHFNVPIYQRLYVWGNDQIRTLLNDLVNAYEAGEDFFFIGGALLVEKDGGNGRYFDLIDGQQRFTTLWMLCQAWGGPLTPFSSVQSGESLKPRLRFVIRPEVNRFLNALATGSRADTTLDNDEAGNRMRTAHDLMLALLHNRPPPIGVSDKATHLAGLTQFIYNKVLLVITTVPRETDLNKLFEVINNRGIQLQHHEILKARMLDALTEAERGEYAVLWEACADMENFIERNLCALSSLSPSDVAAHYKRNKLADAQSVMDMLSVQTQDQSDHYSLKLDDILRMTDAPELANSTATSESPLPTGVRSIFGFPLFLQHTLRIWLLEHNGDDVPRLLDRELLILFENHFFNCMTPQTENVKSFIKLLWRLRVIFDKYIIKWIDRGEEELHLICTMSVKPSDTGKPYISRPREADFHRHFSLLQSMLYHSQEITTHYWMTPLLLFMHRNSDSTADQFFAFLCHLDNHLFGSAPDQPLVIRTRSFMEDPWQIRPLVHRSELSKASGLRFPHYWFYKLEFVLWFKQVRTTEGWKQFRLTAKSSVEHISPQTPTDRDDRGVDRSLDSFGNLALVSRSINSEYGNMPYNEKRARFRNKNKNKLDSLKMDLIYEHEKWGDDQAYAHQKEMIEYLDSYCDSTPKA